MSRGGGACSWSCCKPPPSYMWGVRGPPGWRWGSYTLTVWGQERLSGPFCSPNETNYGPACCTAGTLSFKPPPKDRLTPPLPAHGCIQTEGSSEAAPEAVRQTVGGGYQSGWERLLSVTNAVEAGVRGTLTGHSLGGLWGGGGGLSRCSPFGSASGPLFHDNLSLRRF